MARRGRPRHPDILTPREWEVLALLREGLSNEQLASRLGITERTAKFHVSEIMGKLGVGSRDEAAAWQPGERRAWWLAAGAPVAFVGRKVAGAAGHGVNALGVAVGGAMVAAVIAGIVLLALLLARGDGRSTATATGEQIAFSFQGSIYTMRPDGSELTRPLGVSDGVQYSAPELSPDGQRIAFIINNRRVLVASSDVGVISTDVDLYVDRRPTPPTADDWSMGPVAVHWSPDSEQLLVTRQRLGGSGISDVVLMGKNGSSQKIVLQSGLFIEATWTQFSQAPRQPGDPPPPLRIIVVGKDDGVSAVAYDLEGNPVGPAMPTTGSRHAVASLPKPANEGVLIRSTLGSPEPFGPIDVEDVAQTRVVADGCAATWSRDGNRIAYYDGFGIAIKTPDSTPDDRRLIVTNEQLGLPASIDARKDVCGGLSISWSTDAAWHNGSDGGVKFSYPATWVEGAAPMPYASCACIVVGPKRADPPYGVEIVSADVDLSRGCPISAWFGIRVGFDSEPRSFNLSGQDACQQSMHHQPPAGETRVYRELTTFIDARAGGYFVVAFYRDGDSAAERETLAAYDDLLAGFRYLGKPAEEPCVLAVAPAGETVPPSATPLPCGTPVDRPTATPR